MVDMRVIEGGAALIVQVEVGGEIAEFETDGLSAREEGVQEWQASSSGIGDEVGDAEAPLVEVGIAHLHFKESRPTGECAQDSGCASAEAGPGVTVVEGLRDEEASHEVAGLVEVEISCSVPVVEPADMVEFLPLVPGPFDVFEAQVTEGDGPTADKGKTVEMDSRGRIFSSVGRTPQHEQSDGECRQRVLAEPDPSGGGTGLVSGSHWVTNIEVLALFIGNIRFR